MVRQFEIATAEGREQVDPFSGNIHDCRQEEEGPAFPQGSIYYPLFCACNDNNCRLEIAVQSEDYRLIVQSWNNWTVIATDCVDPSSNPPAGFVLEAVRNGYRLYRREVCRRRGRQPGEGTWSFKGEK